jgi:nucleoside-diphosphate-sugar epimerase
VFGRGDGIVIGRDQGQPTSGAGRESRALDDADRARRAMVTGAAGFIGSHLVEACLERGWSVVAIDSLTDYYNPAIKLENCQQFAELPEVEWRQEDLCDAELSSLMDKVDIVFHLAAQPGVRSSWGELFHRYTMANVTALQRLLEAAKDVSLEKLVFASSSSVYGDPDRLPTPEDVVLRPISPYGATKALGEHLCNVYHSSYGLPVMILRYFTVYGPRQRPDMAFHRIIEAGARREPITIYGDGTQRRDFTYVTDTVEGTLAAALRGTEGAIYNLGGGEGPSLNEILALVEELLGASLAVDRVEQQRGDVRITSADTSLARRELGFAPSVDLRSGLAAQIAWQESKRHLLLSGAAV